MGIKKFIRRFLFFLSQFIILPLLLSLYFSFAARKQAQAYRLPSNVNKIVVGDSRTQMTVNDTLLGGIQNMSKGSEGYMYSYYKLQWVLENNPQIDTLYLGASYHSFSAYFDEFTYHFDVASRYFFVLPAEGKILVLRKVKNPFRLILKSIAVSYENLYGDSVKPGYLGGFETYATETPISTTSIENRIHYQFFFNDSLQDIEPGSVKYFNKIRELCDEHSVTLIALNTPMHLEYSQRVPGKFKDHFATQVKQQHIPIVDFEGIELNDEDFLPDGDHLTISGAEKASLYFKNLIYKKDTVPMPN